MLINEIKKISPLKYLRSRSFCLDRNLLLSCLINDFKRKKITQMKKLISGVMTEK